LAAAPALAAGNGPRHQQARIGIHGGLDVAKDERVDGFLVSLDGRVNIAGVVTGDVYVVRGNLHISGQVRHDVVVVRGDVTVDGHIGGDLVVVGGRAIVHGGAIVQGDVRSSDQPRVSSDAKVKGSVEKLDLGGIFSGLLISLLVLLWLAVTASTLLLGVLYVLLFPRAADAAVNAGRRAAPVIATGVVVGVVGPVAVVAAAATLLGLPFGLGLGAALAALGGLGYVTAALCLGRTMVKGPGTGGRMRALLAGLGILRFAALVPVIGALVGLGATVYGVGALVIAGWRASRESTSPSATGKPTAGAPSADDTALVTVPAAAPPDAPTEPVTVATPKAKPDTKPTVRRGGSAAPETPASDKTAPPKKPAD
jgi:cytoskeletal protein CcmA (bactofilin family)